MPQLKLKKPKPRPAKAGRATRSQNPGTSTAHHEAILVGLTDPFSEEASRARYPDQGAGRTLTFTQRMSVTLTTDANGIVTASATPKPSFPWITQASAVGTTTTWPATFNAAGDFSASLINTYGTSFRPTSYGVRVLNLLSATNASGYLILAKGGGITLSSTTTFSPNNFTTWETHPLQHGGEWHMVGLPRSATAYTTQAVASFNTNTAAGLGAWETIYIAAYGLPASTAALQVEMVFNFEYVAAEDAPISALAEPQPVFDPQMQVAINAVQSAHPPSHKGARSVVSNFVKREAKKALVKHVIPFVAKKATQVLL